MAAKDPKAVLDKVIDAIRELKDSTGSSIPAISKYLKNVCEVDNTTAFRASLKRGLKIKKALGVTTNPTATKPNSDLN